MPLLTWFGICRAPVGGLDFANFLFPNTFYTSPTYFQWGILAIISLKSSVLKASKGRREIRDTNPFLYFRVRHFFGGLVLSGGEGEEETYLVISGNCPLCFCDFVALVH